MFSFFWTYLLGGWFPPSWFPTLHRSLLDFEWKFLFTNDYHPEFSPPKMSLHLFSPCGFASASRHLSSSSSLPTLLNSNGNPFTKSIIHSTPSFSYLSRIMREEKASFLSVSRNHLKNYNEFSGVNCFNGNSSFSSSSSSGGSESNGKELESVNEDDDEDEEEDIDEEEEVLPDRWEVVGLGQAMVDFSGMVDNEFLEKVEIEKGTRKLINHEERGRVLQAMDGCSYKAAAGGSLSNTLVALARLGSRSIGGPGLNVAMTGSIGSDPLGGFYRTKLRRANVRFLSEPIKDGTTGTVIVLTTSDAQRTMLAYPGTSSTVNYDQCLASVIPKTSILVVEGYLFELPQTIQTITKACQEAHRNGALVAVTASDVSCIERHYDEFWEIIGNHADIIFANSDEARELCHFSSTESPIAATKYLSHFIPLVSVTDGPKGSYIGVKGEAVYIPPSPCVPVDTCGAGDAYASGFLYGILRGASDLKGMGMLAAKVASVVVGQQGTRLRVQDAVQLAQSFPFHLKGSNICSSDIESDQISSL